MPVTSPVHQPAVFSSSACDPQPGIPSVHLCRFPPQQPQRLQPIFLSQAGCASEPMLRPKRISHFPSFFSETPLWSGSASSLGAVCVRLRLPIMCLVIWRQCNTGRNSASCHPVMLILWWPAPVYNADGLNWVVQPWHVHLAQNKLLIFRSFENFFRSQSSWIRTERCNNDFIRWFRFIRFRCWFGVKLFEWKCLC